MGAKGKGGCAPGRTSEPSALCSFRGQAWPGDTSVPTQRPSRSPRAARPGSAQPLAEQGAGWGLLAGRPAPPLPCAGLFGPQSAPCKDNRCPPGLSKRNDTEAKSASAHFCQFECSVASIFTTISTSDATVGKSWKTGVGKRDVWAGIIVTVGTGLALSALFCPLPHWHEFPTTLQNGVTFWGRKVKNDAL